MNYQYYEKIIEQLGEILVESDVTSVRLASGSMEMTIQRAKKAALAGVGAAAPPPRKPAAAPAAAKTELKPAKSIVAPRVGIFHLRDPKTKEPMVIVGDEIKKDGKVGTIEALGKIFTVKSEHSGIVSRILIGDEMAVEYGQPLIELGE